MLQPGKLKHRVQIQQPVYTQDVDTGAMNTVWSVVATVWAYIEPLSVRDYIASSAEQSEISTRITVRYRSDITEDMRLYHDATGSYYDIRGVLPDKNTGYEYITLACSTGVKYE